MKLLEASESESAVAGIIIVVSWAAIQADIEGVIAGFGTVQYNSYKLFLAGVVPTGPPAETPGAVRPAFTSTYKLSGKVALWMRDQLNLAAIHCTP